MIQSHRLLFIAVPIVGVCFLLLAASGAAVADSPTNATQTIETNSTGESVLTTSDGEAETDVSTAELGVSWSGAGATHTSAEDADSIHAERLNVRVDEDVDVGPAEPYTFDVINEETGDSITVSFEEAGTLSGSFFIDIYNAEGEISNPSVGDNDLAVDITGDEELFQTDRAAAYTVVLNENGQEVDQTGERVLGIGYTLDYELDAFGDNIEIAVPRDGMPEDAVVEFTLSPPDDSLGNDPIEEETMSYDADRDMYIITFDAADIEASNYSWSFMMYPTEETDLSERMLFAYGFDPIPIEDGADAPDDGDGTDDGDPDDGDGSDEEDDDADSPDVPDGEALIGLTPANQTVVDDGEVTYEIVLEGLDEGLSSYDLTVSVSDTNVATVTDATVERESGFGDEVIAEDNSSVQLERALGDETFDPTDEIVLGEVTLEAAEPSEEAGEPAVVDVAVTDANLNDLDSEPYDTTASDATLEVVEELPAPDVTGDGEPATDTTGDGLLNDIDGSGEFGINDVQLLFEKRNDDAIQDNTEQFDFAGTGDVGIADVQTLFEQLQAQS